MNLAWDGLSPVLEEIKLDGFGGAKTIARQSLLNPKKIVIFITSEVLAEPKPSQDKVFSIQKK